MHFWSRYLLINEQFALFTFLSLIFFVVPFLTIDCSDSPKDSEQSSKKPAKKRTAKSRKQPSDSTDPDDEKPKPRKKVTNKSVAKTGGKKARKTVKPRGVQQPQQAAQKSYKPPPAHERPRHPGFEMPVEPTEDMNTLRQVEGFYDAQNF